MNKNLKSFILNGLMLVNFSGYISWIVYAVAFIALIFKKPDWVGPWVFSLVQHLNVIGIPFIVLFVLLSFVPATRCLGGLSGIIVSRIYTLGGTLTALLIVYSCWGTLGIIVGTGLFGFGILPTGIISSILLHDKIFMTTLLQFTAFIVIGQFVGQALITIGQKQKTEEPLSRWTHQHLKYDLNVKFKPHLLAETNSATHALAALLPSNRDHP